MALSRMCSRVHVFCVLLLLVLPCVLAKSSNSLSSTKHEKETFFRTLLNAAGFTSSGSDTRNPPHAPPSTLSDQTAYVGLGHTGAAIGMGDFNRDRLPDLLMLNTDTYRGVSVQFWDNDQFRFVHRGAGASIDNTELSKIVSAYTADFNNDGILDVLLTDDIRGVVFFGDSNGNFNLSTPLVVPEITPSTAIIDADADLAPELFVAFANGTRGFWRFNSSAGNTTVSFQRWNAGKGLCVVVSGSSIAATDLNGDCQAEFVIPTSCGLEVWKSPVVDLPLWKMRTPDHVRKLGVDVFNAAQNDAVIVYDDFNADGTIDIAVANTKREDLAVHLNIQKPPLDGLTCVGDNKWHLIRMNGVSYGGFRVSSQRVGRVFRGHDLPPSIHVGDFDSDGHADLLIVDSSTGSPALFLNNGRWRLNVAHKATRELEHLHRATPTQERALGGGDAVTAAFFDTGASGRQDILVVRRDNDTRLVWNGVQRDSDALFFRGVALSAVPYRESEKPFAPVNGATFKVSYSSRLTSRRVTRICSQCSQAGHWLLRPCSCVLALAHIATTSKNSHWGWEAITEPGTIRCLTRWPSSGLRKAIGRRNGVWAISHNDVRDRCSVLSACLWWRWPDSGRRFCTLKRKRKCRISKTHGSSALDCSISEGCEET